MDKSSIDAWREVDGDNTLALDWPLDANSHVWEIGGYEGRWAQQIWDKFKCYIRIYEPQFWAVEKMKVRFEGNYKIDIRSYGLWIEDGSLTIGNYHTDGASLIYNDGREPAMPGKFVRHYHEIYNFHHEIDLALMNVEGAEYTLLPDFIASGVITRFKHIWVQFHPDQSMQLSSDEGYIFKRMEETHDLLWNYFPTAVAWRVKK